MKNKKLEQGKINQHEMKLKKRGIFLFILLIIGLFSLITDQPTKWKAKYKKRITINNAKSNFKKNETTFKELKGFISKLELEPIINISIDYLKENRTQIQNNIINKDSIYLGVSDGKRFENLINKIRITKQEFNIIRNLVEKINCKRISINGDKSISIFYNADFTNWEYYDYYLPTKIDNQQSAHEKLDHGFLLRRTSFPFHMF